MKRLLRPSMLLLLLALAASGATFWVFEKTAMPARPAPLLVGAGDREIAWLYSATGIVNWQRFVEALEDFGKANGLDVQTGGAYPELTTAVPEVAVVLPGNRGRLLFRWYKVTSDFKNDYWLKALVNRDPPPLAVIGGNTTDAATDQAWQLRAATADLPEARQPLLLLTTATADRVRPAAGAGATVERVPLAHLYRGRTFRFCFSNHQMGDAVTSFIWSRPDELRPDSFPAYVVVWQDDPYSGDLIDGFLGALRPYHNRTGASGEPWIPNYIPWSVGSFDRPNRHEAEAARELLDELHKQPRQKRPLLVLSGQSQPARRFVRALARLEPVRVRDFVMVTGDALPFNTVCRDRNVTWPIQDLPCTLVFFCHYNPVADSKFREGNASISGTEDLLLYKDIVTALVVANSAGDAACADADQLRDRLRKLRLVAGKPALSGEGPLFFDGAGNRRSGTGEHVVWLQPRFEGERALPEATLRVYAWRPGADPLLPPCPSRRLLYTGAEKGVPWPTPNAPGGSTGGPWRCRCCCGRWWLCRYGSRCASGWAPAAATTGPTCASGSTRRAATCPTWPRSTCASATCTPASAARARRRKPPRSRFASSTSATRSRSSSPT